MRNGRGIGRRVSAAKGFVACGVISVMLGGNAAPQVHDVMVDVTQLRSARGNILACLTSSKKHFPDCEDNTRAFEASASAHDGVSITFRNVPQGTYAIALLHDENGNGKADRALMMMPKEGFGFSRDAKLRMGPPSFSSAAFRVADTDVHQTIRMRYLF